MLEVFDDLEIASEEESVIPKEYGVDFSTGKLTGEVVTGVEALKVWCFFALQIERFRFRAFPWEYGNEIFDLYGKTYGFDYIESEVKRMIEDCVCVHPNISSCEDFIFENEGSSIKVTFSIVTDFGDGKMIFEGGVENF